MITCERVDEAFFGMYDEIPMLVHVRSVFVPCAINGGLGGVLFEERSVEPYVRDMSRYEIACDYAKRFDISNWAVFMAFDGEKPVGGVTVAARTKGVDMLENRDDLCVLWDIRVDDAYKGRGIGTRLFSMAVDWSKANGLKWMKIECQTNNVPACGFYAKQGAVLRAYNEYAYAGDPDAREYEAQVLWYLDL